MTVGSAHPRSRGENQVRYPRAVWAEGSSPLTRGKPLAALVLPTLARLIPAHAGKTSGGGRWPGISSAHPRSRGENVLGGDQHFGGHGSSPLTRGKRRGRQAGRSRRRLIPAHAGKTAKWLRSLIRFPAHPCSRGENGEMVAFIDPISGSSLLTRGKPRPRLRSRSRQRLIPAHAGKTHWSPSRKITAAAHPRSRGENTMPGAGPFLCFGASPVTRGKRECRGGGFRGGRLIPAHAGKTATSPSIRGTGPAHPRACGENDARLAALERMPSSSPLTQGKPCRNRRPPDPSRLILAHAGKTLTSSRRRR